jgi:hypothetical protein
MRDHDVGDMVGLDLPSVQLLLELAAYTEGTDVDENPAVLAAQQGDRAPAEPPMADGASGKALHQHIDVVHALLVPLWRLQR